VSNPSVPLTRQELIERSGVDAPLVDRLVELQILAPDVRGGFGPADVRRLRLIHACEVAALGADAIGPVELKGFSERIPVHEAMPSV
jgi:hypothetical protein